MDDDIRRSARRNPLHRQLDIPEREVKGVRRVVVDPRCDLAVNVVPTGEVNVTVPPLVGS